MNTLKVHAGGQNTFLAASAIETLTVEGETARGVYTVRIRTRSGKEFYARFATEADLVKFVNKWAGQTLDVTGDKDGIR
jgi:hypothetical protein